MTHSYSQGFELLTLLARPCLCSSKLQEVHVGNSALQRELFIPDTSHCKCSITKQAGNRVVMLFLLSNTTCAVRTAAAKPDMCYTSPLQRFLQVWKAPPPDVHLGLWICFYNADSKTHDILLAESLGMNKWHCSAVALACSFIHRRPRTVDVSICAAPEMSG